MNYLIWKISQHVQSTFCNISDEATAGELASSVKKQELETQTRWVNLKHKLN